MYTLAVITVSDKCSSGEREDLSALKIHELAPGYNFQSVFYSVVPDEIVEIQKAIKEAAVKGVNLILTTGGTGFSLRDVTPEATKGVITREAPGIAEALRAESAKHTDRYMLSRGIAGIIESSIIVNLPGSPKAAAEGAAFIFPRIGHGIDILTGSARECGKEK